jgi:hypothetical protein
MLTDMWMTCRVRDGVFEGFGDPLKLEAILRRFKEWAEEPKGVNPIF